MRYISVLLLVIFAGSYTQAEDRSNTKRNDLNKEVTKEAHRLALNYYNGKQVKQDYQKAFTWFRKASDRGYAPAQVCLAGMYYDGKGVSQNHKQAAAWYLKAAGQGYVDAQTYLATMYFLGEGVAKNNVEGTAWAIIAASNGDRSLLTSLERDPKFYSPIKRKAQARAKEINRKIEKIIKTKKMKS